MTMRKNEGVAFLFVFLFVFVFVFSPAEAGGGGVVRTIKNNEEAAFVSRAGRGKA